MGHPISYDHRVKIIRERQLGRSCAQVAQDNGCSARAVSKLWRSYQVKGEQAFTTGYHRCGRRNHYPPEVRELVSSHRTGEQGAPYLVSVLAEKHPDKQFPHERTVQLWWKSGGTNRPKGRPPRPKEPFVREVHHTWQLDGKEAMPLMGGREVSWLNVADEGSSADLSCQLFPPAKGGGNWAQRGFCLSVQDLHEMGPAKGHQGR